MAHVLHMNPQDFGIRGVDTVKAHYASLSDARMQGDANLASGKNVPWFITDSEEPGSTVVFDYRKLTQAEKDQIAAESKAAAVRLRAERIAASLG